MFAPAYDPGLDTSPVLSAQGFQALLNSRTQALDPEQGEMLHVLGARIQLAAHDAAKVFPMPKDTEWETIFIRADESQFPSHVTRLNASIAENKIDFLSVTTLTNLEVLRSVEEIKAFDDRYRETLRNTYRAYAAGNAELNLFGEQIAERLARDLVIEERYQRQGGSRAAIAALVEEGHFKELVAHHAKVIGQEMLGVQLQAISKEGEERIQADLTKYVRGMRDFRLRSLEPKGWASLQIDNPTSSEVTIRMLAANPDGLVYLKHDEDTVEIHESEEAQALGQAPRLVRRISPIDLALLTKLAKALEQVPEWLSKQGF